MVVQEKNILPQSTTYPLEDAKASRKKAVRKGHFVAGMLGVATAAYFGLIPGFSDPVRVFDWAARDRSSLTVHSSCAQADPIFPQSIDISSSIEGKDAKIRDWLSGAVKIPTESFDVMGPIGEDPRWDVFYKFSEYLEEAFPLVHKHLKRTRVVTHALAYEWIGSDPSLKPLMLTGHQDVVPVLGATRKLWTHDPYGGEYDPETDLIWGRGSSDDKSGTIGILSAIELLLESGDFQPTRTVILAFGIDEETGGKGAYALNQFLEEKYGKDSVAILVDEGSGLLDVWGQLYATPSVTEKGYLDVEIRVETPGGHSSVPPVHTGIGYLALLIAELEKHPHQPKLEPDSPMVNFLSCAAETAPDFPGKLKKAVHKVEDSFSSGGKADKKALKELEDWYVYGSIEQIKFRPGAGKAIVTTTQAVDIINGGVKINALPEVVTAVVNHRINIASSVGQLQSRIVDVLSPVAEKFNLGLTAFGKDVELGSCRKHAAAQQPGKIIISEAYNSSLEVAPVSPFTVDNPAWRLLAGTTRAVYSTRPAAKESEAEAAKDIKMAPFIGTGNTDTKRYWDLTRNIYRYAYQDTKKPSNAHTVDESISGQTFIEEVRWFMNFIVNVDEARDI